MELTVTVKRVKRGNARIGNGKLAVTIPQWAIDRSEYCATYYICHEMAHITHWLLFGGWSHNATFKAIEAMYCADFGIVIEYKKAYPKALVVFGIRQDY
jgi:hypothetical protein